MRKPRSSAKHFSRFLHRGRSRAPTTAAALANCGMRGQVRGRKAGECARMAGFLGGAGLLTGSTMIRPAFRICQVRATSPSAKSAGGPGRKRGVLARNTGNPNRAHTRKMRIVQRLDRHGETDIRNGNDLKREARFSSYGPAGCGLLKSLETLII